MQSRAAAAASRFRSIGLSRTPGKTAKSVKETNPTTADLDTAATSFFRSSMKSELKVLVYLTELSSKVDSMDAGPEVVESRVSLHMIGLY